MKTVNTVTIFVFSALFAACVENVILIAILPTKSLELIISAVPQLILAEAGVFAAILLQALASRNYSNQIIAGSLVGLGVGAYCATVTPELNAYLIGFALAGMGFTLMFWGWWRFSHTTS